MPNTADAENTVRSSVSVAAEVVNNITTSCVQKVDVQSGIVIKNVNWSLLGFLRQDVTVNANAKCMQDISVDTKLLQDVKESFAQEADALAKGLPSGNAATAKNITDLFVSLSQKVASNITTTASNAVTLSQPLSITDSKGLVMLGTSQNALIDATLQQVVSTAATTEEYQELVQTVTQAATAKAIGIDPASLIWAIVALLIAIGVCGVVLTKPLTEALSSPGFWFMIVTLCFGGALYFPIAGALNLKVWPYKVLIPTGKNADTADEAAAKKDFNRNILIGTGVGAGCLGLVDTILLLATVLSARRARSGLGATGAPAPAAASLSAAL